MLQDEIRKQMMAAMKAHDTVQKEILRVALGEITMSAQRANTTATDDDVIAIVRKLIKSDEETRALATDETQKATLTREIEILRALIPQTLGEDQVVEALAAVRDALIAAGNDGKATGVAMKHLASVGAVVDGKTVSLAVRRIRAVP